MNSYSINTIIFFVALNPQLTNQVVPALPDINLLLTAY
ncbi:hypothetical protein LDG_8193 [Legionella drancourtii LLAP12]|uniref:Uncharacterized protein n=1 Tax=Legionella drancourtii LLAP12 TaxID=658187 RepID=G9ESC0_9GAMM|nr:hypothetical protein LDG_8193 [Legionella drancourtii LLAP12]